MTLHTSASLHDLQDALNARKPVHATRDSGWASSSDFASNIRVNGAAPPQSTPVILAQAGDYPERLAARFYWWEHDPQFGPLTNGRAPSLAEFYPEAVDVLVSQEPDGSYLLLWSSVDNDVYDDAAESLVKALRTVDPDARLSRSDTALSLGNPDIFLWIYDRATASRVLSAAVTVTGLGTVSTAESPSQSGLFRGPVDPDRIPFLIAIALELDLGPVTVTVQFTDRKGVNRVVFTLWRDGRFALKTTPTHYRGLVDGDAIRLRAVNDTAYRVVPLIRQLKRDDAAWPDRQKALVKKSKKRIHDLFAPDEPQIATSDPEESAAN